MSMTYATWLTAVAGYLPANLANTTTEAPFIAGSRYNAWVDRAIEYAELRMYRDPDLDFLATRIGQNQLCTASNRLLAIPNNQYMLVLEDVMAFLPAGALPGSAGSQRVNLLPVSVSFINAVFPFQNLTGAPQCYARTDDTSIILGPVPDQAYWVQFYGTYRPAPLSSSNTSTYLTTYLPDLFLAATMISWSLYQKNLGAVQQMGPMEGTTWEAQYEELKKGAAVEEARKKSQSAGWSPMAPTPVATPPRS